MTAAEAGLPPHRYVPGQTPRHPEGEFAALLAPVPPRLAPQDAAGLAAWTTGLRWLDAGYFWEAHELLEAVWAALPPNGAERRLVRGLIQIANAGLKLRMGRPAAARRLIGLAGQLLAECRGRGSARMMGLEPGAAEMRLARVAAMAGEGG